MIWTLATISFSRAFTTVRGGMVGVVNDAFIHHTILSTHYFGRLEAHGTWWTGSAWLGGMMSLKSNRSQELFNIQPLLRQLWYSFRFNFH